MTKEKLALLKSLRHWEENVIKSIEDKKIDMSEESNPLEWEK